ncbi:DGQHR domain-containing protein [Fictibacillus sp. FJAT-27399]|uniref:DGQHR domain-containing protein n=1 Tax=Fictibacillus sp. FJAT-27399 TaxID=1729689 RepID=UPI000781F99D|nr:DGQHR domain-containing protein [Fictibacillus sp. FJAT-27399]
MKSISLRVIKTVQKNTTTYIGYMTKEEASVLLYSDHYPPQNDRLGYQRPPDLRRAESFAKYLKNSSSAFSTPILLNAKNPVDFEEISKDYGFVKFPTNECLSIVDGQHRSLGIIEFYKEDIKIPFMLFDNIADDLEQELFITINREQKKVSMSHVHFLGRKNDEYSQIAIKLESDKNSPWFQNVNLVGARGTKRPVSLQSLRSSLIELLQAGEVKVLGFHQKYRIAIDFWGVVSEIWPDAWVGKKNSLLTKSIGTLALSKLGGFLIPNCFNEKKEGLDKEKLKMYLVKISKVNWMSNGDFKGYSGRHGADLIKNELDSMIFKD